MSQAAPLASMLDTNACIHVMTDRVEGGRQRLSRIPPRRRASRRWCWRSCASASRPPPQTGGKGNLQALNDCLAMVALHDWPGEAADLYGQRRAALKAEGIPVAANDLLIGCHALQLGRVLVTQNLREFGRPEGLRVEGGLNL